MCLLYRFGITYVARVDPFAGLFFEDFALAAIAVENGIHVEHLGIVELKVGEEGGQEE